jgi:cupin 2 domain-containing protein
MPPDSPTSRPRALVNLLEDLPSDFTHEHFAEVCQLGEGTVRIERIVSKGHASPEGFWYDQDDDEWILILQGEARLRLADHASPVHLKPGDSLLLPAHCRHRIDWTTPDQPTIWLAVFPVM